MQAGDVIVDEEGQAWTVLRPGPPGLWCTTWMVSRGTEDGLATLYLSLTPQDLADVPNATALAAACQRAADEVSAVYVATRAPLVGGVKTAEGTRGVLLDGAYTTLSEAIQNGLGLSSVIDLMCGILRKIDAHGAHGNLRPDNVLVREDEPVVMANPLVPALQPVRAALEGRLVRERYGPPESKTAAHPTQGWDTWAVCAMLYEACWNTRPASTRTVAPPLEGLGRVDLAETRDKASDRLRTEAASKRFAARATEQLGKLLHRGLSAETEPSPPYRFLTAGELFQRLSSVQDLIHPAVESVSRIMLGPDANQEVFQTDTPVEFSVNVGTTAGVTAHEDIACGVNLKDLDAPGDGRIRVKGSRFTVKRYPSGRWRFNFALPEVPPGRYSARVAFAIKGADESPRVSEGHFQVRPAPGYMPPAPPLDTPPAPLLLTPEHRSAPEGTGPRPVASAWGQRRDAAVPLPDPGSQPALLNADATAEVIPLAFGLGHLDDDANDSVLGPQPVADRPPTDPGIDPGPAVASSPGVALPVPLAPDPTLPPRAIPSPAPAMSSPAPAAVQAPEMPPPSIELEPTPMPPSVPSVPSVPAAAEPEPPPAPAPPSLDLSPPSMQYEGLDELPTQRHEGSSALASIESFIDNAAESLNTDRLTLLTAIGAMFIIGVVLTYSSLN